MFSVSFKVMIRRKAKEGQTLRSNAFTMVFWFSVLDERDEIILIVITLRIKMDKFVDAKFNVHLVF